MLMSFKQKFAMGEFIILASLLKGALELSEIVNSSVIKMSPHGTLVSNPKKFKNKIFSIEKWTGAILNLCQFMSHLILKKFTNCCTTCGQFEKVQPNKVV